MNVVLDTNILTRLAQSSHPMHVTALAAVQRLETLGRGICIVPQNLFEFWAVSTRPLGENGLGLSVAEAKDEYDKLKRAFVLLPDVPSLLSEWEKLIVAHDCKGKPSHDARIVAAMLSHAVRELVTFNVKDFKRYGAAIAALDPADAATWGAPQSP